MQLTGTQFEALQNALIGAFDLSTLRQMVRIGLDENLTTITGSTNLREAAFELIRWAEQTSRVDALLAAARQANSSNLALSDFEKGYHRSTPKPQPNVSSSHISVGGDCTQVDRVEGKNIAIGRGAHAGDVTGTPNDKR